MNQEELRAALRSVHAQLLELHRTLIDATRYEFEREHGRIENPYQLLGLVENDPAFAWLRPLTSLLVQVDELSEQDDISVDQATAVRAATEQLVQPPEGTTTAFYDRLRAQRDSTPALVVLHAHVRQALTGLPRASSSS